MSDTIEVRDLREQDWVWTAKALLFHADVDEKMYKVYNGLAAYADNVTQQAFPSIDTLVKKLHMSKSTVLRSLAKLEAFQLVGVDRTQGVHNTYTLLTIPDKSPPKRDKVDGKADAISETFDCEKYYEQMMADTRPQIQIIGFFLKTKKVKYKTREQVHVAIKQHLRDAKDLVPFEKKLIGSTIRKLAYDWPKFTLGTVVKELTK